ncbi:MaoC family dehydratase [Dechloromonas denitrificans]|uniref:MaoC family dehydratase n=1 Tax=Dechloromonas denitrificans TaxID=281362 RepID=UPI001CF9080D|nr:MaoC family dehydratase [Dechloromonas denitrificans]UCV02070.1 MaoC family dehydratase [Dechloromonas denitrificans]UCV06405.1 MaoC family dehydratase [Dechloromonas denitrificans]
MDTRYLDDLTPGQQFTTPGVTLTEAEIIDFAWRYDPQSFHLDANAAADSPYGGLIASGFQSLAICFRLFIQSGMLADSSMGSPGIDELRWLAPVRPGDTLHSEIEVLEVRPSASKADRGIARLKYQAVNQRGEAVLSFIVIHLLRRRPNR